MFGTEICLLRDMADAEGEQIISPQSMPRRGSRIKGPMAALAYVRQHESRGPHFGDLGPSMLCFPRERGRGNRECARWRAGRGDDTLVSGITTAAELLSQQISTLLGQRPAWASDEFTQLLLRLSKGPHWRHG